MTLQEIFDKGVGGVKAQGQLAELAGDCAYEINGLHCVIGQLVSHEVAHKWQHEFGGFIISEFILKPDGGVKAAEVLTDLRDAGVDTDEATIVFLYCLQACHDSARSVEEFLTQCERLAEQYGLDNSVCQ